MAELLPAGPGRSRSRGDGRAAGLAVLAATVLGDLWVLYQRNREQESAITALDPGAAGPAAPVAYPPGPSGSQEEVTRAFAAFALEAVYPPWILPLLVLIFLQFLLSSRWGRLVYDPVGRSLGMVLFAVIALTAALPDEALMHLLLSATVILCAVSLASRWWPLAGGRRR